MLYTRKYTCIFSYFNFISMKSKKKKDNVRFNENDRFIFYGKQMSTHKYLTYPRIELPA